MEYLIIFLVTVFIYCVYGYRFFNILNHEKESHIIYNHQAAERCSSHPVHNHFLLSLAFEAADFRDKSEAASDEEEKARCLDSLNNISIEVVDTVLALNGFDPHPGVILDEEEKTDAIVVQFSDYTPPKGD